MTKTFGSGIAYPTRTNDGQIIPDKGNPNPKADSYSLYSNWVANRILMNLLPKSQLENKLHKTLRNNRKKAIENKSNMGSPVKKPGDGSASPMKQNKITESIRKQPTKFTQPSQPNTETSSYPKPNLTKGGSPSKVSILARAVSSGNNPAG